MYHEREDTFGWNEECIVIVVAFIAALVLRSRALLKLHL
jgi:hypothetical protein